MAYANRTYVCFDADTDILYYRLMTAWKENDKIEFNFHNAHEINNLRDGSSEETIKAKLRERLKNTKVLVVLIGENNKNLFKYVKWEIDFIAEKGNEKVYKQVCYKMEEETTIEREFKPLLKIKDNYPKYILSLDGEWTDNVEGVKHLHIADFLLMERWN